MFLFFVALMAIPARAEVAPELPLVHFSIVNDWDVEATGHMILFYRCPLHRNEWHATLHDVVLSGFGIMEESTNGFPFPVRYYSTDSPAGVYGYVVKTYPSVYIRLIPTREGFRWEILAIDPSEDGINGNEIPP
ncbi:MAG: hypothetical protein AAB362_03275 [Patescibacteria group bacterium]